MGSATSRIHLPATVSAVPVSAARTRRKITPQSGHALEILSHAIEYLTDEFLHESNLPPQERAVRLEAIELLMSKNRQIYFECSEILSIGDRILAFVRHLISPAG